MNKKLDDREIKRLVRATITGPRASIGQGVISEFRKAPLGLFDDLPDHEKTIAVTAFRAAAAATQNAKNPPNTPERELDVFITPTLGEHRTRAGLLAAAAALSRIPENQRSVSLKSMLEECTCNPTPDLP